MRIVVIGTGVLGASVVFHAARAGADVLAVDADLPGRATSAGAGIISPWASGADDPHWFRIAAEGARYYADLIPSLAEDGQHATGYARVGALLVHPDPAFLAGIRQRLTARRTAWPEMGEVTSLAPASARAMFPPLHPELTALHVVGAARVDGRDLAASLLAAAQRRGARVRSGQASLLIEAGRVRGIALGTETIDADRVVLAAGAWATGLLRPHGITLPIAPQRGQIVHLTLPGTDTTDWPIISTFNDHYLLAFPGSRVVVGATRETGSGFDYRVTAGGMMKVLGDALAVAPGLAGASLSETRIGFRPMAADGRPLLGTVAGCDNLIIGNGLGPTGLTMGPYAGRLLAQLALEGKADLDLTPYDPLRPA